MRAGAPMCTSVSAAHSVNSFPYRRYLAREMRVASHVAETTPIGGARSFSVLCATRHVGVLVAGARASTLARPFSAAAYFCALADVCVHSAPVQSTTMSMFVCSV